MTGIDYGLELIGIGVIVACRSGGCFLIKNAGLVMGPVRLSWEKKE